MEKTNSELVDMVINREILSFDEFVRLFQYYGELEFVYQRIRYGLIRTQNKYEIFMCDNNKLYQIYETLSEFADKANIDGKRLKEIWQDIKELDFLS